MLTALMPTRNRPTLCARQLRFLAANKFPYRIVVLDATEGKGAAEVAAACAGIAEYRHFEPHFRMADKLAAAVADVDTPFVILIPDDDVTLPHAIEAEIAYLMDNPDVVAAHGYYLDFAMHGEDIDIYNVKSFTPSIVDADPLVRHFNQFRRYQSFYWGVFRTEIFAAGVIAACEMEVVLFRELTVMSTSILQGKVARLQLVHTLLGSSPSHAAIHFSNPLFLFLHDAEAFFSNYLRYRDGIVRFIRRKGIAVPPTAKLEKILDVVHAAWLGREIDGGIINHQAQILLGADLPPIAPKPPGSPWREPGDGDLVHPGSDGENNRRYIWRKQVLEAEPQSEIVITADEVARVERQLDLYR